MENQERRCMGCMNPLPEGRSACGICGYPAGGQNPDGYLQVGVALSDRYICGRALSVSGDATQYIGWDEIAKQPVYIREFMPGKLCKRNEIGALEAVEGKELSYESLRQSFLHHARLLARNRELTVLAPIYDIFEQNDTAYTVCEYSSGVSLKNYVKKCGGHLSWLDARKLFLPFLTAVEACHAAGIYHFGISPDTIILGADGKLRLNVFAMPEARTAGSELTPQLAEGFAAPEQYLRNGRLSAATDVYALGATLFWMLSGVTPPSGENRDPEGQDLMMSEEVVNSLPDDVTAALVCALSPASADRFASVEELRGALGGVAQVSGYGSAEPTVVKDENYLPKKYRWIFGGIILALVIAIIVLALGSCNGGQPGDDTDGTTTTSSQTLPSLTTTSTTAVNANSKDVPQLRGKNYWELEEKDAKEFIVQLESLVFNNKPAGEIVVQSPAPGEKAAAGSTIRVIVSLGPQQKNLPDVAGWTQEDATAYLEALGYRVKTIDIAVSTYDAGLVDSTTPEINELASYGDEVTLRISTVEQDEQGTVILPDVTGLPVDLANQVLRSIGLTAVIEETPALVDSQDGTVKQIKDQMTGAAIDKGTEVTLVVYTLESMDAAVDAEDGE